MLPSIYPQILWTLIRPLCHFLFEISLEVSYVESMMHALMYLPVSIVSADALDFRRPGHLSANTNLTNLSICSFELWH